MSKSLCSAGTSGTATIAITTYLYRNSTSTIRGICTTFVNTVRTTDEETMRTKKRKPVKPVVNDKIFNLHNPEYHGMIEPAFEAGGVQYHCFKKDSEMRYGRYIFMQDFLQETQLRMSLDQAKKDNAVMTAWLDGSKGQINIGKVLEILSIHRQQFDLAFEPDTVFRLASCLYFDESEDLRTWDKKYNEAKIQRWKESHTVDFFFHKLFQELSGLRVSSKTALQSYLSQVPETLKGWDLLKGILSR